MEIPSLNLRDIIFCLSDAADLISPELASHHRRVATLVRSIGLEAGFEPDELLLAVKAALIHDAGSLSLSERLSLLQFEAENTLYHCEAGYQLLEGYPLLRDVAEVVRYHHIRWDNGAGAIYQGEPVPLESHLVHLADRIAVQTGTGVQILQDIGTITRNILGERGRMFHPGLTEAFLRCARREAFWLELLQFDTDPFEGLPSEAPIPLDSQAMEDLSYLIARMIDFRSPYTAAHSVAVAGVAEVLGRCTGMSPADIRTLKLAGLLHDLGKLAVPPEILNKAQPLDDNEQAVLRIHSYETHILLRRIPSLNQVRSWCALHHERLDGSGYPFHLQNAAIPLGARVVAVADMFVAITESRPYREDLDRENVIRILTEEARSNLLDPVVVDFARLHYLDLDQLRTGIQESARVSYQSFLAALPQETPPAFQMTV